LAVYTGASVNALTPVGYDNGYLSRVTFIPTPNATYYIAVDGRSSGNPLLDSGTITLEYGETKCTHAADFDRDDKADIALFRPSSSVWYSLDSITGNARATHWGVSTDIPIAGDLDQDGRTDLTVFRPETGTWYINSSKPPYGLIAFQWGVSGDIPQIYRDGAISFATVFRPSEGNWYIRNVYGFQTIRFGMAGDIPVMADYDGDGITDVAVFRPSDGVWYQLNSSNGQVVARRFGLAGDKPVAADYDNDGRIDLAVYRPSNGVWYVLRSFNNAVQSVQWGISEDIPQAGDYDGDNQADLAVFRPSNGVWYVLMSSTGTARIISFGLSGDRPVTATNYVQ
jgi:hypothetical protein